MKEIFKIPNLISLYRLLIVPLVVYFIASGKEDLYAVFIVINLLTDALDGFIARRFSMVTRLGASLDSFADNFTYLLVFAGIIVFKYEDFSPYRVSLFLFIGFLVSTVIMSLIRFRKFPSFHLYSTKIGGYIQGIFFICLFTTGFIRSFYYFVIVWGILGAVEHIVIQLLIPEMRSNVKGLYWILKERKEK